MSANTLLSPLLRSLQEDEVFRPREPVSLRDAGLDESLVESLICKTLLAVGNESGRGIAKRLCLPFAPIEGTLKHLRGSQILVHSGSAPLNDYYYTLTENGRERARAMSRNSAYVGPAPVPLEDYILSVEAQTIRAEAPRRSRLEQAFEGISAWDRRSTPGLGCFSTVLQATASRPSLGESPVVLVNIFGSLGFLRTMAN